jgi:hypothetical protein
VGRRITPMATALPRSRHGSRVALLAAGAA